MSKLTDVQLARLYRALYARVAAGGGGTFGYDLPTLRITRPGLYRSLLLVLSEMKLRSAQL